MHHNDATAGDQDLQNMEDVSSVIIKDKQIKEHNAMEGEGNTPRSRLIVPSKFIACGSHVASQPRLTTHRTTATLMTRKRWYLRKNRSSKHAQTTTTPQKLTRN